jgi:hypothetical protein
LEYAMLLSQRRKMGHFDPSLELDYLSEKEYHVFKQGKGRRLWYGE